MLVAVDDESTPTDPRTMKLHSDQRSTQYRVSKYEENSVSINGTLHSTTVLVAPENLRTDLPYRTLEDLDGAFLRLLEEWEAEVVLIGTGRTQSFPDADRMREMATLGVGVEYMTTPAACRTYNILAAEGRAVVALLLL